MPTNSLRNPLPDIKDIATSKDVCPTGPPMHNVNDTIATLPLMIETKNKHL